VSEVLLFFSLCDYFLAAVRLLSLLFLEPARSSSGENIPEALSPLPREGKRHGAGASVDEASECRLTETNSLTHKKATAGKSYPGEKRKRGEGRGGGVWAGKCTTWATMISLGGLQEKRIREKKEAKASPSLLSVDGLIPFARWFFFPPPLSGLVAPPGTLLSSLSFSLPSFFLFSSLSPSFFLSLPREIEMKGGRGEESESEREEMEEEKR
jgi:hypothetical protein